jgi:hypothetical protein
MNVRRCEVIHVSILAAPQDVVAFIRDMNRWKTWAPWIESVTHTATRDWTLETSAGTMRFRFVEENAFGVLDHEVTLASGVTVANAMRVTPNDSGSELAMVVLQMPDASPEEFERDVQAVRDDFARIKSGIENLSPRQP